MGEDIELLARSCQLHHPQGSFNVALNGLIERGIEIDAGCAVHDHIAVLLDLAIVLWAHTQSISVQVTLTKVNHENTLGEP